MYTLAVLALCVPPPSAATLEKYAAPEIPEPAIVYALSDGRKIAIVPEELQYANVNVTQMIPSCGMDWCGSHARIPVTTTRTYCTNYPTPLDQLEEAITKLQLCEDDVLFDLGCGDGRVCILASAKYGCRSVGIDLRQEAVEIARKNARISRVSDLATFLVADATTTSLRDATVLYIYLRPEVIERLRIPVTVRAGLSYMYPWPGVRKQRLGDFYFWIRPSKDTASKAPARKAVRVCRGGT